MNFGMPSLPAAGEPLPPDVERRPFLDALRGFLLWNSFLQDPLLAALGPMNARPIAEFFRDQYDHAVWHGLHWVDLGFPTYMMVMGASLTLSQQRRLGHGATPRQALAHVLRRAAWLWIFSFFLEGGFSQPFPALPFTGIFIQLAFCLLSTEIFRQILSPRWYVPVLIGYLCLHAALLTLIPVPGHAAGDLSPTGNIENWVRTGGANWLIAVGGGTATVRVLAPQVMWYLTLPKIWGTCLFGLILGQILSSSHSRPQQSMALIGVGTVCLVAAEIWSFWLPINKPLWTPSFVLVSGGAAYCSSGLMILIVELWNCRRFAALFTVFGRNSLLAWVCFFSLPFADFAHRLFGPGNPLLGSTSHPLLLAFMQVALCWGLLAWLHALLDQRALTNNRLKSRNAAVLLK